MTTYDECEYEKHSAVKFGAAFRVDDVTLTDPSTLEVDVLDPTGAITQYTTADGELTSPLAADMPAALAAALDPPVTDAENVSPWTGLAILEIVLSLEGDYRIRWKATGGATVGKEQRVTVIPTPFD